LLTSDNFIDIERRLQQRCENHDITCIHPKQFDSVEETLERKAKPNRAIAAVNKRNQRANQTKKQNKHRKRSNKLRMRAMRASESPEKDKSRNMDKRIATKRASVGVFVAVSVLEFSVLECWVLSFVWDLSAVGV